MSLILNNALKKTSRCLVRRVSSGVFQRLERDGIWALRTTGDERRVWERLLVDDLIVLWAQLDTHFVFVAAEIIGKSLDLNEPKSGYPLLLSAKIHGKSKTKQLPLHGYNYRTDLYCPTGVFADLWETCKSVGSNLPDKFAQYFFEWKDVSLRVAVSQEDFEYLELFAKRHSFGYRKAFVTIVAYKNNTRVGALLCEPSLSVKHPHFATKRVFGSYYEYIRDDSLSIVRIFDSEKSKNRWEIHEALLRGIIEIAPYLVDGTLRIIEAVSYDYHPLALKLGFVAEIPSRPHDSIYYWKPFGIDRSYIEKRNIPESEIEQAVHELIEQRNNIRFFGVYAQKHKLSNAVEQKAWAIGDHRSENRGLWKSLRKGNIVFFITNHQYLEGYGVVDRTYFDGNMPRYPLRIEFSEIDIPFVSADITEDPLSKWIVMPHGGGIFRIGNRGGSEFKMIIDHRYSEGKMWVRPNAFLLPETNFEQIPNQIFVVQSWDLRNSILPVIRKIFTPIGFDVTHTEDREGQIVFGDVWRLLNEAEFVLVDFTEKKPNVYLEYGMALVLGKPIIAITQSIEDLPSDTPGLKAIEYSDSFSGMENLKERLVKAVKDKRRDFEQISSQR